MKAIVEHEIDPATGARTGRTRTRQLTPAYAKAAHAGVWPDMKTRDGWSVLFR